MNEDDFTSVAPDFGDPAAAGIAAAADPSIAEEARAYFREQTELAKLQKQNLIEQNAFELSHLRWRRLNDQLKGAMQIMLVAVGILIIIGIGAAMWNATQASGLVIEPFQTPSDLADKGLTGETIASKLLDRLTIMQNTTASIRAPSSFSNDWTNNIKVAIPSAGISLGEALRYLRDALGSETHLTGEMYETAGGIALTVRLADQPGRSFTGRENDLDAIVQRAAEAVFHSAQPYRYAVWLQSHGRTREGMALLTSLATHGSPEDRIWANYALAIAAVDAGRYDQAGAFARRAADAGPHAITPFIAHFGIANARGRDEDALQYVRGVISAFRSGGAGEVNPARSDRFEIVWRAFVAMELGDFGSVLPAFAGGTVSGPASSWALRTIALCSALLHDSTAARRNLQRAVQAAGDLAGPPTPRLGRTVSADVLLIRAQIAMSVANWRSAAGSLEDAEIKARKTAAASKGETSDRAYKEVFAGPQLAYTDSMLGLRGKAHAILKSLPPDCYVCMRMRGKIAANEKRYAAAAWWFARAVKQAPSIPFAYADWGELLLRKGDADGAIEKFRIANEKGPHFAEPLEMWGEASIAKLRSDLALAKFAEANKYAPKWGRLHLKWGEALLWAGHKADAQKQFATAAHLDLSAADKSQLARLRSVRS